MSSPFSEVLASKAPGIGTALSSIALWLATVWDWVDANLTLVQLSSFVSFLLLITMLVMHWMDNARKTREHRSLMREREINIELQNLKLQEEKRRLQENNLTLARKVKEHEAG